MPSIISGINKVVKRLLTEPSDRSSDLCRMEFLCDDEYDVRHLPTQHRPQEDILCAAGSLAYILEPFGRKSRLRILTSEGKWREVGV